MKFRGTGSQRKELLLLQKHLQVPVETTHLQQVGQKACSRISSLFGDWCDSLEFHCANISP